MTTVTQPVDLRLLIEEQSWAQTLTEVLETEPLEDSGLNTLTSELHRGRLSSEVSQSIIPGISGVSINFPSVSLLGGGPVRDAESLEESSLLSVESNFSYTLSQSFGVEILSIDVIHVIWFFVELIHIKVFNSDTNFTSLFDVEPIGNECDVRMGEPDDIAENGFNSVSRIEQDFDPSTILQNDYLPDLSLGSQLMIEGSGYLSFIENAYVDSTIQKASL